MIITSHQCFRESAIRKLSDARSDLIMLKGPAADPAMDHLIADVEYAIDYLKMQQEGEQ